jgi:hypothetical protein
MTSLPQPILADNLKRSCHHLGDRDRACIKRICSRLDLPTAALAIRYAVRLLDKKLSEQPTMTETAILLGGVENETGNTTFKHLSLVQLTSGGI